VAKVLQFWDMSLFQIFELVLVLSAVGSATVAARNRLRRLQELVKFRRIEKRLLD